MTSATETTQKPIEEMSLNEIIDAVFGSPRNVYDKMLWAFYATILAFFGAAYYSREEMFQYLWAIGGVMTIILTLLVRHYIPLYLDFKERMDAQDKAKAAADANATIQGDASETPSEEKKQK